MGSEITPEQCRAARALLGWSRADLAQRAHIAARTIQDFERGATTPQVATLTVLRMAFEAEGLRFERGGVVRAGE